MRKLLIETFARAIILFASKEKARRMRCPILIDDRLSTPLTPPANKRTIVQKPLIVIIKIYQLTISPFIGRHCRFQPSCSRYAIDAIEQHGAMRGSWLAIKRIGRCQPWREGGYDPVPAPQITSTNNIHRQHPQATSARIESSKIPPKSKRSHTR